MVMLLLRSSASWRLMCAIAAYSIPVRFHLHAGNHQSLD